MNNIENEIENEKKLSFDSKDYLLKLIKEVDLNQRVNFNLTPLFTDQYEYSASLDYLEEKQKYPENSIFVDVISDNSTFRDSLLELLENSKIASLNENNANISMEKSYFFFKKEKKYCYELELKMICKNDVSNLLENDLNLIDGQMLDQCQCQVCNLRFKKIQSHLLKLSKDSMSNINSVEIEALKIKCM